VNKIISIINLLFTRLGFNLVNASHAGHAMTFLLETDLTARRPVAPGENTANNRSAPKESGSGADFARSLAGADNEPPESEAPKPSTAAVSSDAKNAVSVLIEHESPEDIPVATDTPPAAPRLDIKSDIILEGKTDERAEAEPLLADMAHADDADKALPVDGSVQRVAVSAAPMPPPSAAPVEAEASEPIVADGNTAALTRTAAPQDELRPAPFKATNETPEAREGNATEATSKAAATSSLTAVGVAQDPASKITGAVEPRPDTAGSATAAAPASSKAEVKPEPKLQKAERHRTAAPTMEIDSADTAALSALSAEQNNASKLATSHDKAVPADPSALAMTAGTPPTPVSQSPAPITPPVMAPTNALVVATPAEVVDILSDSLASPDEKKNHVHIQLDPPELGRVSLDFKFDTHGLQHVTIVGETPEAMRQLRLMHFELVNALERQGLSSENMSYQQQQTPHDSGQQTGRDANTPQRNTSGQTARVLPELVVQNTIQSRSTAIAGLNIKL
jgi:hypothetical protein